MKKSIFIIFVIFSLVLSTTPVFAEVETNVDSFEALSWDMIWKKISKNSKWQLHYLFVNETTGHSYWLDVTRYMEIFKEFKSQNQVKITVVINTPAKGDYRLVFAITQKLKNYATLGDHCIKLEYKEFVVEFDWSDIAEIPGVSESYGVTKNSKWFYVKFRRNNVPANYRLVLDPILTVTDTYGDTTRIQSYHDIYVNTTAGHVRLNGTGHEIPHDNTDLVGMWHLNDFVQTSNDNRTGTAMGEVIDSSGWGNHGDLYRVSTTALEGWWAMEDGNASATMTDLSGNGNTITWTGKAVGDHNTSLSFDGLDEASYHDGVNDILVAAPTDVPVSQGNLTLIVWARSFSALSTNPLFAGRWQSGGGVQQGERAYGIYFRGGVSMYGYVANGTYSAATSNLGPPTLGAWTMGTVVFDFTHQIFYAYVNDTLRSSISLPSGFGSLNPTPDPFRVGYYFNVYGYGEVDGVFVYNRTLTLEEIRHHYRQWVTGRLNQALWLDGVDDYVNCRDGLSLDVSRNFTLSAWIRLDSITPALAQVIVCRRNTTGFGHYLAVLGDEFLFGFDNIVTHVTNMNLSISTWYYVVGVADDTHNRVHIYVDAIEKVDDAELNSHGTEGAVDQLIGMCSLVLSFNFNGTIDEVRVYNRSLEMCEIQKNYYARWGILYSTNLLRDINNTQIESFIYDSTILANSGIDVSFSQDNATWVNSDGILGWEAMSTGSNNINLRGLDWVGNFYYRVNLTSDCTPYLNSIGVNYNTSPPTVTAVPGIGALVLPIVVILAVVTMYILNRRR